jgi:hypothetical protein
MARYRLTKKAIILIIVLFLVIGGGTSGYLYWRLNNDKTVAPTESDASTKNGGTKEVVTPSKEEVPKEVVTPSKEEVPKEVVTPSKEEVPKEVVTPSKEEVPKEIIDKEITNGTTNSETPAITPPETPSVTPPVTPPVVTSSPSWSIAKTGNNVCLVNTPGSMKTRVYYTIKVTNVGSGAGTLTQIVDTLDTKVKSSYIQSATITPVGAVENNVITWTLDSTTGAFAPAQERTFSYSIIIPEKAFGEYTNTAVATPTSGNSVSANKVAYATCTPIPETGLFDTMASKIAVGIGLIFISFIYLSSNNKIFDKMSLLINKGARFVFSNEGLIEIQRKRFEIRKRKFENRVIGK